MADISQIQIGNDIYNIKDNYCRQKLDAIGQQGTISCSTASWVSDTIGFKQQFTISGIKSTDVYICSLDLSSATTQTALQEMIASWNNIRAIEFSKNKITVKAIQKPDSNIIITYTKIRG